MRTTVRLDDDLLARVKHHALEQGTTLTQLFDEALRELLGRREQGGVRKMPAELPTFRGEGLQPGVDLDDSAALLDLMEGRT